MALLHGTCGPFQSFSSRANLQKAALRFRRQPVPTVPSSRAGVRVGWQRCEVTALDEPHVLTPSPLRLLVLQSCLPGPVWDPGTQSRCRHGGGRGDRQQIPSKLSGVLVLPPPGDVAGGLCAGLNAAYGGGEGGRAQRCDPPLVPALPWLPPSLPIPSAAFCSPGPFPCLQPPPVPPAPGRPHPPSRAWSQPAWCCLSQSR